MLELTILSPHRDDAIFSLGLSMTCWSRLPIRLQILNFFTISQYAPTIAPASVAEVSAIRKREDQEALRSVSQRIELVDLDLLDAPLRPGLSFEEIMSPASAEKLAPEYLTALATLIAQHSSGHLLLAPFSIGDHVDHVSVFRAATLTGDIEIGFYEDLPYSAWVAPEAIKEQATAAEQILGILLAPVIPCTVNDAENRKRQQCMMYSSQIGEPVASQMGEYSQRYGGGEQIWVPASSNRWASLRN